MRKHYLDYLRVLAIVAVIIIHNSTNFYTAENHFASLDWWFTNFLTTAARFSVPIFIVISGALLLTSGTNIGEFYKNRALRLIPPTIIWMIFFTYFKSWSESDPEAPHRFFTQEIFIYSNSYYHLWFLPMFLCLMAFAPFFAKWVNGETWTPAEIRILFLVVMAFFILKWVSTLSGFMYGQSMNWLGSFIGFIPYFLAGHYLSKHTNQWTYSRTNLLFVIMLCIALGCAGNYYLANNFHIFRDWLFMDTLGPLSLIMTLAVFLWARQSPSLQRESKIIKTISDSAFGIYLIHPIFIFFIMVNTPEFMQSPIIYIPLASLLTFIAAFACVYCLKKLPGGRLLF